jgi:RNA polymerase sigma-70 factor (ECF subfamily)
MIERTDETLIAQFQERGDREALASLLRRHQSPVYSYLLRLLRNPHDAEEAAQETFLRVLRGLAGYRSELPFRPWLYRIAQNCARTVAARKSEQGDRERRASENRPEGSATLNPADAAIRQEIYKLVDGLPEAQKEAVTLHYGQGLSHSEVASVLEVPAGTVATRIHTGLQSLRTRLAALGIAAALLSVEEALRSADAATAPASLMTTILREAAQAAPSGAGAASIVQGGVIVGKMKLSTLVALAIVCSAAGGVAGYGIRSTRAERELAALQAASRPREVALASAPEKSASRTPVAPPPAAALPAPGVSGIPAANPLPKDDRATKVRKLATFFAKFIKYADAGPVKPEMDPKESSEFLALLADPELQKTMADSKDGGGSIAGYGEDLWMALLEAFNVHLSDAQKAQAMDLLRDQEARKKQLDPSTATAVDRQIAERAASQQFVEQLTAMLTPEQRDNIRSLLRVQQQLGDGVQVAVASDDRMVPSLLDSWSQKLIPLSEDEKARVAQTAAVHAGRLATLETELSSQYGPDFMERFDSSLGSKMDLPRADPVFDPQARDAYDRFLELERQNRQALIAALPERADDLRKAAPNVFVLTFRKK